MSQPVEIPDELYSELEAEARSEGLDGIASLLEREQERKRMLAQRRALFERINANRQAIFERTGLQPDSVPLIREDRDR